jgi:hypothetical protein
MNMIRTTLWILLLVGYLVMVWHGVTGDTGPMGWLNALQQHWTGGYSRKLSFLVLCFGTITLSSPILLPLMLTSPAKPPAQAAPVQSHRETVPSSAPKPRAGWKTVALAWSIPVALVWIATFSYHAWEWHLRTQDATQRYQPIALVDGAVPVANGSHVALPGRFLWDRTIVRRERGQPESTYVPVVDRAWREGEPVRFIAKFESRDLAAWRTGDSKRQGAILARVDGAVPTAAFGVFAKAGATLAPSAALIVAVAARDGQPAQKQPAFAIDNAILFASVLTVVWTVSILAITLAFAKQAWSDRRHARRAAQGGIVDGPRRSFWIGGGIQRW